MHVHETGVCGEVGADFGAAADDAQEAGLDERCERALVDRHQGILRGIHLEQRGAVVGQQLVEHVQHRDRGHVARAEHQADAARFGGRALRETGRRASGARCDARFQPDLARETRKEEGIDSGQREGVHASAPSRGAVERDPVEGVRALRQTRQGLDVGVERTQHAVRPTEPLLAAQRMTGIEALRGRGRGRPVFRGRGDTRAHRAQQRDPLGDREGRPGAGSGLEGVDSGVEALSFGFAQRRGPALRRTLRWRGGGGGCARRSHRRLLRTGSQLRRRSRRRHRCPRDAGGTGAASAGWRPSARRAGC